MFEIQIYKNKISLLERMDEHTSIHNSLHVEYQIFSSWILLDPDPRGGWRPLIKQGKTLKVYRKLNQERTLKAQIVAIYWKIKHKWWTLRGLCDNRFQPFQSSFLGDFPSIQCIVSPKSHKISCDVSVCPIRPFGQRGLWISVVQDPNMENHYQRTYHSITIFNLSWS